MGISALPHACRRHTIKLVVISIIAVLAAMLLPALSRPKGRPQADFRLNLLRRIATEKAPDPAPSFQRTKA